jgi:hypothetical protein
MLMNRRCIIWVTLGWVAPILLGPLMLWAEGPIWTRVLEDGGNIQTFLFDPQVPSTIYASGWGIFKSLDHGISWTRINSGLPQGHISSLAINPQNPGVIYAGHFGQGVFKSADAGITWSAVGLSRSYVLRLAIDPQHTETLYAGTAAGAFKTTDGGRSWTQLNISSISPTISIIAIAPRKPSGNLCGYLRLVRRWWHTF